MTGPHPGAPGHGVDEEHDGKVSEPPGTVPPATVSGDVAYLHPCGEFDMANQHELGTAIHHAMISGYRLVVVDLGDVTFIDASVIRMFLRSLRLAQDRGRGLRLENVAGVAELILRALQIGPPLWDGADDARDTDAADGAEESRAAH